MWLVELAGQEQGGRLYLRILPPSIFLLPGSPIFIPLTAPPFLKHNKRVFASPPLFF